MKPVIITVLKPLPPVSMIPDGKGGKNKLTNHHKNLFYARVSGKQILMCIDIWQFGVDGFMEPFAMVLTEYLNRIKKPLKIIQHTIPKLDKNGELVKRWGVLS